MQSQLLRFRLKFINFRRFADWRILISLALILMAAACGGGGSLQNMTNGGPTLSGNTNVTIVVSSTANDQLTAYDLQLLTITLTDKAGKTVNLLSSQQPLESIHLNGSIEPFVTLSVPQDIYTSATATEGATGYLCTTLIPSGQQNAGGISIHSFFAATAPNVTINMPTPITVSGPNITLLLNMDVTHSASFSCTDSVLPFTFTPTFNLTSTTLTTQPTNTANGKLVAVNGTVTNVDTTNNQFTFSVPEGPSGTRTLNVKFDGNTQFQGINGFNAGASSLFADIDGAIQADGSLLATRVEVKDSSSVNLFTGPVLTVNQNSTVLKIDGRLQQGQLLTTTPGGQYQGAASINYGNAVFQISAQMTNLLDLPFVPTFTAANMVPGQNVNMGLPMSNTPPFTANTVTLMPQTVDGTVASSTTSGSFTVYTVTLASYDLFPTLAVQPGQSTLLTTSNEVQVYVDTNTQMTNQTTLGPGSTFRFQGLVFNDNGTLRMDCSQVADGVAQ